MAIIGQKSIIVRSPPGVETEILVKAASGG